MTIAVEIVGPISGDFALDVAFEVPATGVTALLGPSGSGKTTVLRALAGLSKVKGTIRFQDDIWQDGERFVPAHRRRVGYVFQGQGLLPHLTVRGNLAYAARRAPSGPFAMDEVVARTGVGALLDRSPHRLSGGEAQRAALARALMAQPRMLLLDEPLAALDGEARDDVLAYLESLLARIDVPVFHVTHDAVEAERLASRTIRMRGGTIESFCQTTF